MKNSQKDFLEIIWVKYVKKAGIMYKYARRDRTEIMEEINGEFRRCEVELYIQGNRGKVNNLDM